MPGFHVLAFLSALLVGFCFYIPVHSFLHSKRFFHAYAFFLTLRVLLYIALIFVFGKTQSVMFSVGVASVVASIIEAFLLSFKDLKPGETHA